MAAEIKKFGLTKRYGGGTSSSQITRAVSPSRCQTSCAGEESNVPTYNLWTIPRATYALTLERPGFRGW